MNETKTKSIAGWPDRVRELMDTRGLTYDDLTAPLGVSTRGGVSHYFQGRRSLSADQAVALADFLGCSLEWLLKGEKSAQGWPEKARGQKIMGPDEVAEVLRHMRPEVYQSIVCLVTELSQSTPQSRRRPSRKDTK